MSGESQEIDVLPIAAMEVDGEHECMYGECDADADWLVEMELGTAFFCCNQCSRNNRIWVVENDLHKSDVSEEAKEHAF